MNSFNSIINFTQKPYKSPNLIKNGDFANVSNTIQSSLQSSGVYQICNTTTAILDTTSVNFWTLSSTTGTYNNTYIYRGTSWGGAGPTISPVPTVLAMWFNTTTTTTQQISLQQDVYVNNTGTYNLSFYLSTRTYNSSETIRITFGNLTSYKINLPTSATNLWIYYTYTVLITTTGVNNLSFVYDCSATNLNAGQINICNIRLTM
jgi:hypothetical protein